MVLLLLASVLPSGLNARAKIGSLCRPGSVASSSPVLASHMTTRFSSAVAKTSVFGLRAKAEVRPSSHKFLNVVRVLPATGSYSSNFDHLPPATLFSDRSTQGTPSLAKPAKAVHAFFWPRLLLASSFFDSTSYITTPNRPAANSLPSGEKATTSMNAFFLPGNVSLTFHVPGLPPASPAPPTVHSRTVRSAPPDARPRPSGANATDTTGLSWPLNSAAIFPVRTSMSVTKLSAVAAASSVWSGANDSALMRAFVGEATVTHRPWRIKAFSSCSICSWAAFLAISSCT